MKSRHGNELNNKKKYLIGCHFLKKKKKNVSTGSSYEKKLFRKQMALTILMKKKLRNFRD